LTGITSIKGRIIHDSRGNKTIEVDIISDNQFLGRTCAPAGASVGKNEAINFPEGKPEESLRILNENSKKFLELDPNDLKLIDDTIKSIDKTSNFSKVGGALAFAVTIAAMESAAKALGKPLFKLISEQNNYRFPIPLGNLLGGGAHAGPGTPDIQEILISATGAKTIRDAVETNFTVHKELRKEIEKTDSSFTNGRGDEGGWAPKCDNEKALELCARTCENLGYTLGKEVSLGVDFASSTQWNEEKQKYIYERAGFENTPEQQIEFASSIIEKYKLNYAEDAVHEESFEDMSKLTSKFPNVMITGDDLTVTNEAKLKQAIDMGSCNAAILKVNQAGSLFDALEFAKVANNNNIKLITSHRSGESIDSHITHIGIGTNSKLLKIGIVGGERVAKSNELIRLSEHDLIQGVAQI
jgi:enolase